MKRILLPFLVLFMGVAVYGQTETMRIVYDASKGSSTLTGAEKVYMHSGSNGFLGLPAEQFWGEDNGFGEMTLVADDLDLWEITINVREFYGLTEDDAIGTIGMVFRNADGGNTGKDYNDENIYIHGTETDSLFALQTDSTAFDGVTAQWLDDAGFVAGIEDLAVAHDMIAAPNPFSDRTQITYTTTDENVRLVIYNMVGQAVRVLVDEFHNAGEYTIDWNGTDESGSLIASGQYFYVMESASNVSTKRLLFVK